MFLILMELNDHKEEDEIINCSKIPSIVDYHKVHSLELEWNKDGVIFCKQQIRALKIIN